MHSKFVSNCTADSLKSSAARLVAGAIVAFPTETVYGLGADACNSEAVARIYKVKDRPTNHPLIVHIASMDRMSEWTIEAPEYAISLAREFWPGPMTLVLRRSELAKDFLTGGQDTVGLRVPDHAVALGLLEAFERAGGKGVAAPSANRFGQVSPTSATAVVEELGEFLAAEDSVLDGGNCAVGVESTIIDCTGEVPRILRPGAITAEMIIESTHLMNTGVNKVTLNSGPVEEIRVSGSLESHYSPSAKIYLDNIPIAGQGFIALAEFPTPEGVIRLASPVSNSEFARVLYDSLRKADHEKLSELVVLLPKGNGIAIAIRDRLVRASHK